MRIKKLLPITGLLLFFTGCDSFYMMCSLNPFYIDKNVVLMSQIEGSWIAKAVHPKNESESSDSWSHADTTSIWTIKRFISKGSVKNKQGKDSATFHPENYYIARISNQPDSIKYNFKVVLFRVKENLYADFVPDDKEGLMKSKLSTNSFFEVHTLARVTLSNNQVGLSWLGSDCMKEVIEQKRVRVNYQWVETANKFLLTASSDELTGMIERYAHQPRFIDWENQKAKLQLIRLN